MTDMKVVCLTSDKYLGCIPAFAYLFNKFWSKHQKVEVVGFTFPEFDLPDNFSFFSVGKFADYPAQRWADAVIRYLSTIPDEQVIILLEDYWLTQAVDTEAVWMAHDYCKQFGYVTRFDLTSDRACSGRSWFYGFMPRPSGAGQLNLLQSDPESQYHMSLQAAVWNKGRLLRVLRPGESAWQTELDGTTRLRSMKNETIVLGYEEAWRPLKYIIALRQGSGIGKVLLDGMPASVREELLAGGYLKPWGLE